MNIVSRREIAGADDPEAKRAELIADYRERFANPYVAANRGYLDDVIDPAETRPVIVRALRRARQQGRQFAAQKAREHTAIG